MGPKLSVGVVVASCLAGAVVAGSAERAPVAAQPDAAAEPVPASSAPPQPASGAVAEPRSSPTAPPTYDNGVRRGDYLMATFRGGFVQRNAPYTAAELRDPAYERQFRPNHPRVCDSGKSVYMRREVRWYEPTVPGGERCAAVIHLAACTKATFDSVEAERIRAGIVALEPEQPYPPHCGSKSGEILTGESFLELEKRQIVRKAMSCRHEPLDPERPLEIWPTTRIGVKTVIDLSFDAKDTMVGDPEFVRRSPESVLGTAAYNAGETLLQFTYSGDVPRQGTNIAIEQQVGRSGDGYCITLTATQAGRTWRRSVDRPTGTSPAPAIKGWAKASPVIRDGYALASELRASLRTTRFALADK